MEPAKRIYFGVFHLLLFFLVSSVVCAHAADISKEVILAKYEKAVSLTEELNVYEEDVLHILPKIRLASKALLQDHLEQADRVLEDALTDLAILESKKPKQTSREWKLEWLEIYLEVFQKYALLALLAYLLFRWPFFHRQFGSQHLNPRAKLILSFLVTLLGGFLSLFDLSRYGETAWAFFDIQVVLVTAGGLLGGWAVGLSSGVMLGIFRWFLQPQFLIYPAVVVGAGVLSSLFALRRKSFESLGRTGFFTGVLAGTAHGLLIYLPAAKWMTTSYLVFSVGFIALLEGIGVFLFLAVISGLLREEKRNEMEKELLKTKLLFLQAQMNPHFVFNSLSTISAICARENAAAAQNLVIRLADFLRRMLKRADEMVTLEEEMSYIDAYLELEMARLGDRLRVEKKISIQEDAWKTQIPLLVLQPLVENAVKHGIGKKETGGTVTLTMSDANQELKVEIKDDGMGMDRTSLSESEGAGVGLRNIHERLNRLYGKGYGLRFESNPGQGTCVMVKIPIRKSKTKGDVQ